jgi:tachykinin-like receptor
MEVIEEIQNSTVWPWKNNGSANDTLEEEEASNQFILPWWKQLIWTILFGMMVVVATGGNLIVIWIVLAHKRMRTVTNYFLVNLSIADAMVSTLNVTFNYTYMLNSDWPFGTLYCKISQFVAVLSICASVFTLMAISVDRSEFNFIIINYNICMDYVSKRFATAKTILN